jgi:putative ABC transport system permease protein
MSRRLAEAVYRFLLRAYPSEFRHAYGAEAVHVFSRLHADAVSRGIRAVLSLWLRSITTVVSSGLRERLSLQRSRRRSNMLADFTADACNGVRSLRRRPAFAAAMLAVIAIGVGATTTIYSVVDTVLLRPLPYPESERLTALTIDGSSFTLPDFQYLNDNNSTLESTGAVWNEPMSLTDGGDPERVAAAHVTRDVFPLLGMQAWRGRVLSAGDHSPGAARVAVITPLLWTRRWGADADIIGRTINLDGEPLVIVGVLNPDFVPPEALDLGDVDVYIALDLTRRDVQNRDTYILTAFGRIRANLGLERVRSELDMLSARLAEQFPYPWRRPDGTTGRMLAEPLVVATVGDVGRALWTFLGAVALMLLIACANVANLFLARGTEREQEMALRAALGASRSRIVRQVLTESVVLSLIGGIIGVALAYVGVRVFGALAPGGIPRLAEVRVDTRILAFAIVLSVFTGVLFGLAPALLSSRARAGMTLQGSGSRTTTGSGRARLRNVIVIGEVALALILLTGSGLLFTSFVRMRQVETGFQAQRLLTVRLDQEDPLAAANHVQFVDALTERIAGMPGVSAVGASWRLPFAGGRCCWSKGVLDPSSRTDTMGTMWHPVTPGYFRSLGVAMIGGRDFTATQKVVSAAHEVIVGRRVAERFWSVQSAVGRTLLSSGPDRSELRIVGVVENLMHWGINGPNMGDVYLPFAALGGGNGALEIGIRHDDASAPLVPLLRTAVRELDPDLPITRIATMEERISESIASPRFYASLLVTFATFACLLAAAGVYSSMLYIVGMRRREMGIRLALGAKPRDVVRLVLTHGTATLAAGTLLGLIGVINSTRVLQTLLFEVSPTDPVTLAAAVALLGGAGLVACYLPARRAGSVDPIATLRSE